jgi:hypothetical protein
MLWLSPQNNHIARNAQVWKGQISCSVGTHARAQPGERAKLDVRTIRACGHLFCPAQLWASDPGFWDRYKNMPPSIDFCSHHELPAARFDEFWRDKHNEGALVREGARLGPAPREGTRRIWDSAAMVLLPEDQESAEAMCALQVGGGSAAAALPGRGRGSGGLLLRFRNNEVLPLRCPDCAQQSLAPKLAPKPAPCASCNLPMPDSCAAAQFRGALRLG